MSHMMARLRLEDRKARVRTKYRITVELRQVILNYFKDGKDPVGIPGPTAIVVGGSHCRLSNIDEKGCWIRTDEFWLGSQHQVHVEGTSAQGRLAAWRQIRRQ